MTAAIAVRERPLVFSGEMVRAILDGRKTQTRRIIKPQPKLTPELEAVCSEAWDAGEIDVRCPFGQPGDRLWVRESWAQRGDLRVVAYAADGECGAWFGDAGDRWWLRHGGVFAPGVPARHESWRGQSFGLDYFGGRWRSSRFMPRWASRITLDLTEVRVERVQHISEADAIAEGVSCAQGSSTCGGARQHYRDLWEFLNHTKKRPFGWDVNPWVWVLSFRRVTS